MTCDADVMEATTPATTSEARAVAALAAADADDRRERDELELAERNYREAYSFAHDEGDVPFDCIGFAQHVRSLNVDYVLPAGELAGLYRRHVAELKAAASAELAR